MPSGSRTVVKLVGCEVVITASKGSDAVAKRLDDVADNAENFQPVMQDYGDYLISQHIPNQFAKQGAPKRWARLSDKYAAWKRANYGNLPKLVLTGRMRGGFKYETGPRSLRVINRVTAGQGRNKTPRWVWHQDGTENMPARPMLQIGKKDHDMLRKFARLRIISGEGIGL